jgi:hypothetical protein
MLKRKRGLSHRERKQLKSGNGGAERMKEKGHMSNSPVEKLDLAMRIKYLRLC